MPTANVLIQVTGIGTPISNTQIIVDTKSNDLGEVIPDASVDLPVAFATDISALSMFAMVATGGGLTVKTNSSGSPDDTIVLTASVPILYTNTGVGSNPFTVDVTSLFVSNSSGTDATLVIKALEDATP